MASPTATHFDVSLSEPLEIPPRPPSHPFRLRRVLQLLRSLRKDPEQTEKALEVFDAVGGDGGERTFQRFVEQPEGRRLLREQPRIEQLLARRDWLASLPLGSFGRAYYDFATTNGFAADGISELNRNIEREGSFELDPYRQWFWDRFSVSHDLWHVITGCDTTPDGEGMLLAFTQGQSPQRGYRALIALIAFEANIDLGYQWSLFRAWRTGKRARSLVLARWEELLERPIDDVRRELGVEPIRW